MDLRDLVRRTAHSALFLLLPSCSTQVGDPCTLSNDCSRTQLRHCDLSVRVDGEGECIVEDCDPDSCPRRSSCVTTYASEFVSRACDPDREDRATCSQPLTEGQVCSAPLPPLDDCNPNEICLPEGLCADELSGRTSCRASCKSDRDCRAGYACRWTGSNGIYPTYAHDDPDRDAQVRICMPVGP